MSLRTSSKYSDTNSDVYLSGEVTVNTTGVEAKVGASRDPDRQFVRIYNKGNDTIYFGPTGLTTDNMEPLEKRQWVEIAAADLEVILKTASGTVDVVVQEIG